MAADPTPDSVRRRRWPWIVLALVLVVVGAALALVLSTRRSSPADVGAALDRFRDSSTADVGWGPRPGVYPATVEAIETVGFGPLDRSTNGPVPVTVTGADGGCSEVRVDIDADHWRSWRLCSPDGSSLGGGRSETARSFPSIDFRSQTTVSCDPPAEAGIGGSDVISTCQSTSDGSMARSGEDVISLRLSAGQPVRLDGVDRPTQRLSVDGQLTGSQTGTEQLEFVLDSETGLPLSISFDTSVRADTSIGAIRYVDRGTVRLTSADPAT